MLGRPPKTGRAVMRYSYSNPAPRIEFWTPALNEAETDAGYYAHCLPMTEGERRRLGDWFAARRGGRAAYQGWLERWEHRRAADEIAAAARYDYWSTV